MHESTVKNMDFNAKNFRYTTMAFGDFAREVQAGKRMYLRALSPGAPADQAANFERDFPALAADFSLPQELVKCADNVHSSVLRISGPVNMWLHYGTSLASSSYLNVTADDCWLIIVSQMSKQTYIAKSTALSECFSSRLQT